MIKRLTVKLLVCTMLFTCLFSGVVLAESSSKTIDKMSKVNNYLKNKYYTESSTNTRVSEINDKNGNTIVKYNYSGTVLITSEFKLDNNEWVTVAHNGYGFPFIAAYGKYGEELGEVSKRLSAAFNDIFNGKYDFSQNKSNIAWIYLDGTDYEKMDNSKLKAIVANSDVNDVFFKEAFEVSYTHMKIVPYLVIGYEKTPGVNDGNKVYASTAQAYMAGMYYKTTNAAFTKSYNFNAVSQASKDGTSQTNTSTKEIDKNQPGSWAEMPVKLLKDSKLVDARIFSDYRKKCSGNSF